MAAISLKGAEMVKIMRRVSKLSAAAAFVAALASPAAAGGDAYPPRYYEAPPVTVYAQPLPSPPPVIIGNAVGGLIAGAIGLPFAVLGGLFNTLALPPPPPACYDPSSGAPMPCQLQPAPYAPPPAYPEPSTYGGPHRGYDRPAGGCYDNGVFVGEGNPDCRG